jgi:hypothetical protein
MPASRFTLLALCLIVLASAPASAQEERQAATPTQEAEAPAVTVAASATESGVRFTAPGVAAARVEVFAADGAKLFDSDFRPGGVLDLAAGQLPVDGEYLCVVTFRELSGRLRQRYGVVAVESGRASLRASSREGLSAAQTQAWESSRAALAVAPSGGEDEGVAVVSEAEARALVVASHDGRDGSLTSTSGALTLRTGDVLSGKDREHVRVTEDGKVGVGTTAPEATLDVAGDIRASGSLRAAGGIRFDDGSALNSADGKLRLTNSVGAAQVPVDGAGTTNQVTKWTNGPAGTLGDSAITETGGNVGIGATNPFYRLVVGPNVSPGFVFTALSVSKGAGQSVSAYIGTPTQGIEFGWQEAASGRGLINAPGTTPIAFTQNGVNERMRIHSNGFVGVGVSEPLTKLDVAGDVQSSGKYMIGGRHALSMTGANELGNFFSNTFAGESAGENNTPIPSGGAFQGQYNSFYGFRAGRANTTGCCNSYFGAFAGGSDDFNPTGSNNTAVGHTAGIRAGSNNTYLGGNTGRLMTSGSFNTMTGHSAGSEALPFTGTYNTFLGAHSGPAPSPDTPGFTGALQNATAVGAFATVTQNNSLVLGSINGIHGASATANVGIGTTAPLTRLDVRGNVFVGLTAGPSTVGVANAVFLANDGGAAATNSFRLDGSLDRLRIVANSPAGSGAGAGIVFSTAAAGGGESERVVINPGGTVSVNVLGAAGPTPLCRNASNEIATCTAPGGLAAPQETGAGAGAALADTVREQREQIEEQRRRIEQLEQRLSAFERLLTQTPTAVQKPRQ